MKANLFSDLPTGLPDELFTTLVNSPDVRIERIVSHGHASPADFWYDQTEDEWVLVLKGAARLKFEEETVGLGPGDSLTIAAHRKHRVEWTTPDEPTVWLAVFWNSKKTNPLHKVQPSEQNPTGLAPVVKGPLHQQAGRQ